MPDSALAALRRPASGADPEKGGDGRTGPASPRPGDAATAAPADDGALTDEVGRQCALVRYDILDTGAEPRFERIVALVRTVFDVPIAAVSLIDDRRQWFKAISGLDASETAREVAFCDHTIRQRGVLAVRDARLDVRFRDNPLVIGAPFIRAYLGAPLVTPSGYNIGSLCAVDRRIRVFGEADAALLASFAALAMEEMELRRVATCDALTGLQTRRAFCDALEHVARSTRIRGANAALLVFDIDHFKRVNDTFGHPCGDAVLQSVAESVSVAAGEGTPVGRIGGEEFGVILPGLAGLAAVAFAERLRATVAAATVPGWTEVRVTASFGVADLGGDIETAASWLAAADAALYRAKNGGRNRVAA